MFKTKINYFEIRFKKILKTKYFLIASSFVCLFAIVYGLVFSIGINQLVSHINITWFYLTEVIVYSITNITLIIYCIWKLFYDDNNDGVNKLEMRTGLTKRFMYFYRLLLIFLFAVSFLLIEYLLNSIFYASAFGRNKLFAYRLFISSFGWLAFISFFTIFISLFITTIFKSRFVIVFSSIIAIILLFGASISGNFISNKADASNSNPAISKLEGQVNGVWWENALEENDYVGTGVKFTNYYEFYQVVKTDEKYHFLEFLRGNYDSNLTDEQNFENILNQTSKDYDSLNQLFIQLYQENPNDGWYDKISVTLIETKDPVLVKYGEILSHSRIYENVSKFALENDDEIKIQFYDFLFNSFLICEKGQEMDFLLQFQVKLIDQFNKKMKINAYFNPLYNLNLMFFGTSNDYYLDNLMTLTRPLFKQALNITFKFDYQVITFEDETGKEISKIIINSLSHQQTISISYLVSVNVLIFIAISCLMYFGYFGYKVKK